MAEDKDQDELKDPRSVGHDAEAKPDKGDDKKDDDKKKDKPEEKPRPRWPLFLAGAVVLVFIAIVLLIIYAPHSDIHTDDAYVTTHYATIAPRVSGQVVGVFVNDNRPVRAGQLLVTLDDRDYQTALADAEATLETDQARTDQAAAEVGRQSAVIAQSLDQVASNRARLLLAEADATRYANLAATGANTVQQHQQADATLKQDRASLQSAENEVSAQRRQRDALVADGKATRAQAKADAARVERAKLSLSYTRIAAPIDGSIDQRTVQVGDYVSPGSTMMVVSPLQAVYVLANYRELALRHVRPGQRVAVHVDAYNIVLDGVVDSIPPASGATYSPLPPNNATGNFTKIVQRLPVKIVILPNQPLARLLKVGMSVETTVHTGLENVVDDQRRDGRGWVTAR